MIDEKKIIDASYDFEDGELVEDTLKRAAFKCGIKWFKDNLWHSINEVPEDNSDLVYVNTNNEVRSTEDYNSDSYDDNFGSGWGAYVRITELVKWAYKKDLLTFL